MTPLCQGQHVFSVLIWYNLPQLIKSVCIIHLNTLLLEAARNIYFYKPWNASLCFSHHQWSHVTRVWNQVGPEEVSAIWQVRWSGIWRSDWKQWRLLWQVRLLQTNSPSLLCSSPGMGTPEEYLVSLLYIFFYCLLLLSSLVFLKWNTCDLCEFICCFFTKGCI